MTAGTAQRHTSRSPKVLEAYGRALAREAHVLAGRPDLVFPQLHDRLQWEEGLVAARLAAARARRAAAARPWLRTRQPRVESAAHARTLTGHSCVFSPDGSWLVAARADGTLVVWDTAAGTVRATLPGHRLRIDGRDNLSPDVTACAVSPDGARVVSGGRDGTLRMWDVASGGAVAQLPSPGGMLEQVEGCVFVPGGDRVLFTVDTTLELWDVGSGDEPSTLVDAYPAHLEACAIRADGRRAVAVDLHGAVHVWDVATGGVVVEFDAHEGSAWACAYAPDGGLLATGGDDGSVRLWDADTAQERASLVGHYGAVGAVAFDPGGDVLASAGEDGTVRLWDVATGQERALLVGHDDEVSDCVFSPDGSLLASAGEDGDVRLWDVARGGEALDVFAHDGPVLGCAYSADGTRLATVGEEAWVLVWDAETLEVDTELGEHHAAATVCVFSPDGTRLASASRDRTVGVWDLVGDAKPTVLTGLPGPVHGCAFSPDGRLVATVGQEGYVVLWDTPAVGVASTTDHRWVTTQGWTATACAFSPDGGLLATADDDGGVVLRNVLDGSEAFALTGHTEAVRSCAFGPDGSLLAAASDDGTVCVWDVGPTGECSALVGHLGPVLGCAFTPDGGRLVSAGADGTVRVWDLTTRREVAALSLPGNRYALAVHPWLPRVALGEAGGGVNVLDLVGLELGPIVVTAERRGRHLLVWCPACGQQQDIARGQVGTLVDCPTAGCGHQLRVNPFMLAPSVPASAAAPPPTRRGRNG